MTKQEAWQISRPDELLVLDYMDDPAEGPQMYYRDATVDEVVAWLRANGAVDYEAAAVRLARKQRHALIPEDRKLGPGDARDIVDAALSTGETHE